MNYLDTLKNIGKDPKRKKENLILLLILLVILLISINYIFNEDKTEKETVVKEEVEEQISDNTTLEEKLSEIINQISGITEASIVINYSNKGSNEIVYDTKETLNDQGNVLSVEKSVAYNEENGNKTAIIQMYNTPSVEGVIVVGKGVGNSDIKQRLSTAIGNLLGIASYKVQIFEK